MPLLRSVLADENSVVTRGRTIDNAAMLPKPFLQAMQKQYGNTRLGRQELEGELIEELEGALWSRSLIERCRVQKAPEMQRILVAVDPPISAHGDECGIIVCGLGADDKGYVLADVSLAKASPKSWAKSVANAADVWSADRVVAEANQGGAMVESTLRAASINLPVKLVHASRGKVARAEPVAALFEAGRAFLAGAFPALEDQLCGLMTGGAYEGPGRSPDRADALVWAMTELMLGKRAAGPRARLL